MTYSLEKNKIKSYTTTFYKCVFVCVYVMIFYFKYIVSRYYNFNLSGFFIRLTSEDIQPIVVMNT